MRSTTKHQGTVLGSRDRRDEDDAWADDESGPSWTKVYVGGMKFRSYEISASQSSVSV